ncbi:MAG: CBS domain-containing protein [Candidatus Aminicenantales bacterium]
MATVKHILEEKGHDVWTITPQAKVIEALRFMAEKGVGALVVTEGSRIAGIISERDYARKIALQGRMAEDTPVGDIMTTQVYGVHPSSTAEECMALMTDRHIRHLPVLEKEKLVGVISIGDAVKSIISQQKLTIAQLEDYIMGKYQ